MHGTGRNADAAKTVRPGPVMCRLSHHGARAPRPLPASDGRHAPFDGEDTIILRAVRAVGRRLRQPVERAAGGAGKLRVICASLPALHVERRRVRCIFSALLKPSPTGEGWVRGVHLP